MGKGRDKQGREAKKKKKVKLPGGAPAPDLQFRHHAVVSTTPAPPPVPAQKPAQ
jgi:hypothetical protein